MREVLFRRKKIPMSALWLPAAPLVYWLGHWFEKNPDVLEKFYALSIQKILMQGISRATGILPFSLAEVLFWGHVMALLILLVILMKTLFKGGALRLVYRTMVYLAMVYVVFMLVWGLNYSRQPLADTLGLKIRPYTLEELHSLSEHLLYQANTLREGQLTDREGIMRIASDQSDLFSRTSLGYDALKEIHPIFDGDWGPPKPLLSSGAMLHTGITGVFMPFTGEANVNVRVPDLLLPATAMHEKAHQMGIAREDEANYVAYLSAMGHPDSDFQYSGTVLALIHATNALYRESPEAYYALKKNYSIGLERDLAAYRAFWASYEGPVNDRADQINDTYLKSNHQIEGVKSYGRMVDLILADFLARGAL
ncbi:MAG: hypothetical protein AVO33_00230 [delta proteobacterium ML8_F1]|nr:MAG: hypothetical protein AVO33_00230 [delta proteobacterium ML8_F1]